ncbi:MAG: hypothetical protein PWP07_352 [Epulopiscium sp.]|jgi:hypothetical protein|nr:hypothetical protein [Defluviitaleaceae bacterium]MDK2787127.1 hypothetical protein [Candidatus Epulonipiscium sp.]
MKKKIISSMLMVCFLLGILPNTMYAATNNTAKPSAGWHYLRIMWNYLNVDKDGNIELRNKTNTKEGNTKFRIHDCGNGDYEFELEDGRYLGLEITQEEMAKNPDKLNELRVKAVKKDAKKYMTVWNVYSENNYDLFNLRPRMNKDYVVNASGEKKEDGTAIIVWKHADPWICAANPTPDAPHHAEIRFIPILPAVFSVRYNNTPYRDKPDGKILGEFGSGQKVWVTRIDGNWATIKYKDKEYSMWAPKLTGVDPTVTAPIVLKSMPSKDSYKVGETFDIKGLNVVNITDGKETTVNSDLKYYMQEVVYSKDGSYKLKDPVEIKPGYKFNNKLEASIEIKYQGVSLQFYSIEIIK